ncbi:MAG: hypothetical protein NZ700_11655 [Gemmataceae bacterium]|nr:hypothetical protein [Gemmataceae bacterium]MDW8265615.1 hypothetical protein [Gemmataceae bacterium]
MPSRWPFFLTRKAAFPGGGADRPRRRLMRLLQLGGSPFDPA